jgi:hypothetical protein
MIQKLLSLTIGLCLTLALIASARAADSAELTRTFDAYNVASKAGNVDRILSFYPAEYRKEVRKDIAKKENRKAFVLYSRAQVPEAYEVQHIAWSKNRQKATLYLLSRFSAMPEINRPGIRMEEAVVFVKEKGTWKIDSTTLLVDPDAVKRPQDLTFSRDDVNREIEANIRGRIVRTEFMKDHTLVILRVMDEEHAVFLPPQETLIEAKVLLDDFKPWTIHEFWGNPHKSDKLKFFANGGIRVED